MTIYFSNPGLIDLNTIRTMGVSVKETDSPIGYFGTGLKYAIAVLLRERQHITLRRGDERFEFSTREVMIRNQPFDMVFMGDEQLSFTTDLGKDWEVWQAYRELHSNTMDEGGTITEDQYSTTGIPHTIFACDGAKITRAFNMRNEIFLTGKPIFATDALEIYEGQTNIIFNKGVRAAQLSTKMRYTYNFPKGIALGEDRNFRSGWDVNYELAINLAMLNDKELLRNILSVENGLEAELSYDYCSFPSDAFLEVAEELASNADLVRGARTILDRNKKEQGSFPIIVPTELQREIILEALHMIEALDCIISIEEINLSRSLGVTIHGLYHTQTRKIYLSTEACDIGIDYVAATLYEEWVHREHGFKDNSREMQNFLFQKIIALIR